MEKRKFNLQFFAGVAEKALTGLDYIHYAEITEDTDATYTAGTAIRLPGAMTWGADQSEGTGESYVAADDNAQWYGDSGSSASSETHDAVLGEMFLRDYALLRGGVYDEATDLISFPRERQPVPKIALSFASLQANGEYRMFKYYLCQIRGVSQADISTRSGSAAVYNITLRLQCSYPKITDADMVKIKDGPLDMAWLQDFTDYETIEITP